MLVVYLVAVLFASTLMSLGCGIPALLLAAFAAGIAFRAELRKLGRQRERLRRTSPTLSAHA